MIGRLNKNAILLEGILNLELPSITKKHKKDKEKFNPHVGIISLYDDTSDYYNWLLSRRFSDCLNLVKPLRKSHITIISEKVNEDLWIEFCKSFNKKKIKFWIDPTMIHSNSKHWWICVESIDVQNLRKILGLQPEPFFKLHLTIGLCKDLKHELEFSNQCVEWNKNFLI